MSWWRSGAFLGRWRRGTAGSCELAREGRMIAGRKRSYCSVEDGML